MKILSELQMCVDVLCMYVRLYSGSMVRNEPITSHVDKCLDLCQRPDRLE